jgi:HEAT repeat protein
MLREHLDNEPRSSTKRDETLLHVRQVNRQESVLGALALLLGTETEETTRIRAVRRLARAGTEETNLLLLLRALNEHPEITSPPWPWEPPQYAHCGRLLYLLSRNMQLPLDTFLFHPSLSQPTGPMLWVSVIEAVSLMPPAIQASEYESLLRTGLVTTWMTVRYSAAMALANLAGKVPLQAETVKMLQSCQDEAEALPVRIAASCALLYMQEDSGLEMLIRLLKQDIPEEGRKAAAFVLAMEQPLLITQGQREGLTRQLMLALQDPNEEVAQNAARALRTFGNEELLEQLCALLRGQSLLHVKIAVLIAIEEMTSQPALRTIMQRELVAAIVPLLRSETPEVRQQASYTLASIGGTYAAAVLGAIISNADSPAYLDAIEGLRLLHGALRSSWRAHVVRWLLYCLQTQEEQVQITALDSLAYIAWQAQVRGQQKALLAYSEQIEQDGTVEQLLTCENAWVRQRTIELVALLACQQPTLHSQLLHCLLHDEDSGVRACAAYVISQLAPHWRTSSPIPDLILALTDPDEHVAETALNALALLTSADDPLVVYVFKEITAFGYAPTEENSLIKATQALLKTWGV